MLFAVVSVRRGRVTFVTQLSNLRGVTLPFYIHNPAHKGAADKGGSDAQVTVLPSDITDADNRHVPGVSHPTSIPFPVRPRWPCERNFFSRGPDLRCTSRTSCRS